MIAEILRYLGEQIDRRTGEDEGAGDAGTGGEGSGEKPTSGRGDDHRGARREPGDATADVADDDTVRARHRRASEAWTTGIVRVSGSGPPAGSRTSATVS